MTGLYAAVLYTAISASAGLAILADRPNAVEFPPVEAKFVRLLIHDSHRGQPCIDELEVYGLDGKHNMALARDGAKATASSLLPGYLSHQVRYLNDGRYGNSFSWIAAGARDEWAQVELPKSTEVAKLVFSRDRVGRHFDRVPVHFSVEVSGDGQNWQKVRTVKGKAARRKPTRHQRRFAPSLPHPPALETLHDGDDLLRYAWLCEAHSWWRINGRDPIDRSIEQFNIMIERSAAVEMDVANERITLAELRRKQNALLKNKPEELTTRRAELLFDVRGAKRQLMFRQPELAPLEKILFVQRHAFQPTHNYSVNFDAQGGPGGAICTLDIPRHDGRLQPEAASLTRLFESGDGIARNPIGGFDVSNIYFGYRRTKEDYYHLMVMKPDGSGVRQMTDGPFHDYWPCPLPDGGIAFISTRCRSRFLCWRPQTFVLFRMDADGRNIRPLSYANLSEWAPSVTRDGQILWTRSEYLDKGADFGHTLWTIRPDGTHPTLVFGNNTINCYANAREVPGTDELCCTLVSHGGDLNGPIALVDLDKGPFDPEAITSITPDVPAQYHMEWSQRNCFRDPVPIARDYFLCSHAPHERFGLYVIDRFGNRELLHLDPSIDSMCPTLLRAELVPPALHSPVNRDLAEQDLGQFTLADVYQGIEPAVRRGDVQYLRVCEEVRAGLIQLPNGEYQQDHKPFQDWYATPTHKVHGPHGWPSYVAKATWGIVPVEKDGSANFLAPAGKVLYFQALDKDFNELQRMRSVVQLQPGEKRSCIGCHENRQQAPPVRQGAALLREPSRLQPPSWGAGPFSYEEVVQPVWDAKCVSCHHAGDKQDINLSGALDRHKVPASYRTLIVQGWVHYFDLQYWKQHAKADPRSFGTLQSKLWEVLDQGHYDVKLSTEEMRRVKCWIDLNCPLWPDYIFRGLRSGAVKKLTVQRTKP